MKLTRIYVENFLGIRSAQVSLDHPITLFAGENAAGKSSLQEAIRMALIGEPVRVDLKKEYGALVNDQAKGGFAEVAIAGDQAEESSSIVLPSGKASATNGYLAPGALPYALHAQRFSSMDEKARRTFLFGLMGIRITPETVLQRLVAKGLDQGRAERVVPMLRAGFEAACTEAKAKATEAKGAWRALTNETYGAVKAGTWTAPRPVFDQVELDRALQDLADADTHTAEINQTLGALQSEQRRYAEQQQRAVALAETAGKVERIRAKLATDEDELTRWDTEVARLQSAAGAEPRVGLVHDLGAAVAYLLPEPDMLADEMPAEETAARAALAQYQKTYGPVTAAGDADATAKLPGAIRSRDLLVSAVTNDKRDLAAAERAAQDLEAIEAATPPDANALADAQQSLATITTGRTKLQAQLSTLRQAKAAAEAADTRTATATAHHNDVGAWTAIADALAPEGIPGEMLGEALGPINARLHQSATDAEWLRVAVGPDMTITGGDRPYHLLSESEQWRVDAMLAEAISFQAQLKLLVLDRFDVLDAQGRTDLLAWLDVLATNGELETALLFGTLKALPTGLPATATAEWISNGRVGHMKEAA